METAHPDRKASLDFDQARPAVFLACRVRAPVLDEFYDPLVGDADIDGFLDFVLVHELPRSATGVTTCRLVGLDSLGGIARAVVSPRTRYFD
jgi:hypothetical protein